MTSSFKGGQFQFEESGNVAGTLEDSFKFSNRSDTRAYNIMQRNWETDIRTSGSKWAKLAKFAPNVTEFIGQKAQERENAKKAQLHLWYVQNQGEGLEEQVKEWKDSKAGMREEFKDISEIVDKDEDMPWHVKKRFKDFTYWERSQIDEFAMQQEAGKYAPGLDPFVSNAVSPDEYAGAIAAYDQKFYEQFGDLSPAVVYENVTKHVLEVKKNHQKKWNTEREADYEDQQLNLAGDKLLVAINSGDSDSLQNYTAQTWGVYKGDLAKIRAGYDKIVNSIMTDPTVGNDKLQAIGDQVMEDGTKLRDHHAYKHLFQRWGRTHLDALDAKAKQDSDNRARWGTNKLTEVLKEVHEGEPKPNKYFEDLTEQFITQTGSAPAWIETLRKNKSIEGLTAKGFHKWAEQLKETDNLTLEWLSRPEIPKEVYDKFKTAAEEQDKLRNKNDLYNAESFQTLAETNLKGDRKKHPSVDTLGKKMYARFKKIRRELAAAGIVDNGEAAYKRIDDWYQQARKDGFLTHNGYKLDKLDNEKWGLNIIGGNHSEDVQDKLKDINTAIGSLGGDALKYKLKPIDGVEATPFGSKAFFEEISKGYGTPGFKLHPRMAYIAQRYNDPETGHKLHPLAVLNIQRKTLGLPELGQTDQEILFNKLEAQGKAAALNNKQNSVEINARALYEIFDPDPNVKGDEYIIEKIVPNGKEVIEAAKSNNLDPCTVAAAEYAISMGLDRVKVITPGTWEHSQYQKWSAAFSGNNSEYLNKLRLRTNR